MNFFKKADLFLANMGNMKAIKRNHVDSFIESIMQETDGKKIAASENGGIWIEYQELAGYNFLDVTIIGTYDMKTFQGCELTFVGGNAELKLTSDTKELESDFSNVSNRWITQVSFDITNIPTEAIENSDAEIIRIDCNKTSETFKVLK